MIPHALAEAFLLVLGLCVGSFLNVVVYRLSVGLSIHRPARSFCPRCGGPIAWYDNLPVFSWLLLRGGCRQCGESISTQYPLVEALTGFAFVLVYHLLFVEGARGGPLPVLPADSGLLLAWLTLVAGLIAVSAMDIVSYTLDVRITNVCTFVGVLCAALAPPSPATLGVAAHPAGAAAVAAIVVGALIVLIHARRLAADVSAEPEPEPQPAEPLAPPSANRSIRVAAVVAAIAFIAIAILAAAQSAAATGPAAGQFDFIGAAGLLLIFLVAVMTGAQQRPADEEIQQIVEHERPLARRTALRELLMLLLPLGAGAIAWLLAAAYAADWSALAAWSPRGPGGPTPIAGLAWSAFGAVVGAGAGWALRIVFTLAFGREAFGTGDIYILAAAGAVGGWEIALLGLVLSVGLALAGWLLGLLLKASTMIPLGPWLAIGFLLALFWRRPAAAVAGRYWSDLLLVWQQQPAILWQLVGMLLVVGSASIWIARRVRSAVERSAARGDQSPPS